MICLKIFLCSNDFIGTYLMYFGKINQFLIQITHFFIIKKSDHIRPKTHISTLLTSKNFQKFQNLGRIFSSANILSRRM